MKNTDDILSKMLAETREIPVNDHVPYAFEKRIMAHLEDAPAANLWDEWAGALWRAVVPCLGVLALVAVLWKAPAEAGSDSQGGSPAVAAHEPANEDLEGIVMLAIDPELPGLGQ